MIPAGYMAKYVNSCPDWLKAGNVTDIYSVSGCVSKYFTDYTNCWKHNDYWFFDSIEAIREVAEENSVDFLKTSLFYYEFYEFEYDEKQRSWVPFILETQPKSRIVVPEIKTLEGYDILTFYAHSTPECSPLSCNSLALEIATNRYCLLSSFDMAKRLLEEGRFINSEPGPYRIFAVYSVPWQ